jgi:hypothetical protein
MQTTLEMSEPNNPSPAGMAIHRGADSPNLMTMQTSERTIMKDALHTIPARRDKRRYRSLDDIVGWFMHLSFGF